MAKEGGYTFSTIRVGSINFQTPTGNRKSLVPGGRRRHPPPTPAANTLRLCRAHRGGEENTRLAGLPAKQGKKKKKSERST
jgi:hypothetical protein